MQDEANDAAETAAATHVADPNVGAKIKDRYRVERELGRGGFGVVYLARDEQLSGRQVVVKILQKRSTEGEWFEKKLQQEREALARINHPGVVGVLDWGETSDGRPFLVMQFVDGLALRAAMRTGLMPLTRVANIFRQLGQALSAAHDLGVYHRDLKPENVLLQDLGEGEELVKIIDFGIATVREVRPTTDAPAETRVAGSQPYMAPEQLLGRPSAASDIWALGVIAYEIVAGERPFWSESQAQLYILQQQGVKVKPVERRPDLPLAAQDAILKALAFDASQRYSRARDFGGEFARTLTAEPKGAVVPHLPPTQLPGLEMAYVLIVDIVEYSLRPTDQQGKAVVHLHEAIRASAEYVRAQASGQLLSLPTGDGVTLVFFHDPAAPARCALQISRALKNFAEFKVRMGMHYGPVYRQADINANMNVTGGGINLAQRVMDCGDAGHILMSRSVAEVLGELSEWAPFVQDLGEHEVKHGLRVHLFNLHTEEAGNTKVPEKLLAKGVPLPKDAGRRQQIRADLKVTLPDMQGESGPDKQTLARWVRAVLLLVLLIAGFFAWQGWRAPHRPSPFWAVALTTFPGVESYPTFSPDGNHVAFMWNGPKQDNNDIYVQQIGSGSPLRLTTDPRSDYNPVWSPDGRWIAFLRGQSSLGKSELRLIPPLGGPERKLLEIQVGEALADPSYFAWFPDNNYLVVTDSPSEGRPEALFVVSLETGEKRQLTSPQDASIGDTNPAVSPDGRSLVFRRVLGGAGVLYWLPLGKGLTASGEPRRLTPPALNAADPAWVPDGKEILFSAKGSLWRLAIPNESSPMRLPFVGEDGLMPVVSRPQPGRALRLVYVRKLDDSNIWRVETSAPGVASSSPPVTAISSTRLDRNAQFSADGRRVAFESTRSGDKEIWVSDPDGSNAVQVTSMGDSGSPRWSPDGQLIAFDSNIEGYYEIYVVPVAGGMPRRLTSHAANNHVPSFSRDGKWIYFSSNRTGRDQIWKIPASGGEAVQVTDNGGYVALESLDGAYVYYTQTPYTPGPLWVLPTSGGEPVKVLEGVSLRAFAVLERGIYYMGKSSGDARLQFFDFATGRSTTVARSLGEIHFGLTASPDGRTILYSRVDSSVDDLMLVENFR